MRQIVGFALKPSAALLFAAALALSMPAPAFAQRVQPTTATATMTDAQLQTYVETNVREALASLSAGQAGSAARAQRFNALMTSLADVNGISTFVLGRYSAALRQDAALRRDWIAAFTDYAFATYEDQLDAFRGFSVRATGLTVNQAGRDVMVRTEMTPPNGGRATIVQWRVVNQGQGWRVFDVVVNLRGNELPLGVRQKRVFEAKLDRSRGDVRALIADVRAETATLRARLGRR